MALPVPPSQPEGVSAMAERLLLALGALAGRARRRLLGDGDATSPARARWRCRPSFLLFHAAALVGIAALILGGHVGRRAALLAGWVLVVGLALFSGDLAPARPRRAAAVLPERRPDRGRAADAVGWIGRGGGGVRSGGEPSRKASDGRSTPRRRGFALEARHADALAQNTKDAAMTDTTPSALERAEILVQALPAHAALRREGRGHQVRAATPWATMCGGGGFRRGHRAARAVGPQAHRRPRRRAADRRDAEAAGQSRASSQAGLRVTQTRPPSRSSEMVLAGSINKQIVGWIAAEGRQGHRPVRQGRQHGARPQGDAHRRRLRDSNIEKVVDLGFVGEPEPTSTARCARRGAQRPSSFPCSRRWRWATRAHTYNVNADTFAGAIAGAMQRQAPALSSPTCPGCSTRTSSSSRR